MQSNNYLKHIHSAIRPLLYLAILNASHCGSGSNQSTNNPQSKDKDKDKDKADKINNNEAGTSHLSLEPDKKNILALAEKLNQIRTDAKPPLLQRLVVFFPLVKECAQTLGLKEGETGQIDDKEIQLVIPAIEKADSKVAEAAVQIKNSQKAVKNAQHTVISTDAHHAPKQNIINAIIQLEPLGENLQHQINMLKNVQGIQNPGELEKIKDIEKSNELISRYLDGTTLNNLKEQLKWDNIQRYSPDLVNEAEIDETQVKEWESLIDSLIAVANHDYFKDLSKHVKTFIDHSRKGNKHGMTSAKSSIELAIDQLTSHSLFTDHLIPAAQKITGNIIPKISSIKRQITQAHNTVCSVQLHAEQRHREAKKIQHDATEEKNKLTKDLCKKLAEIFPVIQNVYKGLREKRNFSQENQERLKNVEALCNRTAEILQKSSMQSIEANINTLLEEMEKVLRSAANTNVVPTSIN